MRIVLKNVFTIANSKIVPKLLKNGLQINKSKSKFSKIKFKEIGSRKNLFINWCRVDSPLY